MLQGEDGEIVTWRVDTEEQNITAKARLSRHDRFSAGTFFLLAQIERYVT